MGKVLAVDGVTQLNPKDIAYPCGLIAKTVFNDTYSIFYDSQPITIDDSSIAWQSDVDFKFKN
jgi:hypothetical protein